MMDATLMNVGKKENMNTQRLARTGQVVVVHSPLLVASFIMTIGHHCIVRLALACERAAAAYCFLLDPLK